MIELDTDKMEEAKTSKHPENATPLVAKHTLRLGAKLGKGGYVTIAIIGKTGTGKSTVANALLRGYKVLVDGQELFETSSSVNSVTKECKESIGTLLDLGISPL